MVQFEPGSDVANKGVQVDDIITKIDDIPLTDSQVIASILEGKKAGDTVKLTVFRPRTNGTGSYFDVTVTLMSEGSTQMQGQPVTVSPFKTQNNRRFFSRAGDFVMPIMRCDFRLSFPAGPAACIGAKCFPHKRALPVQNVCR